MSAAATVPDPTDVCAYGHQLAPGSEEMVLKEYDAEGRKIGEKVVLLRNHACIGPKGIYAGTPVPVLDDSGKTVRVQIDGYDPQDHGLSPTVVTRLVPYPCGHALPEAEVDPTELPPVPLRGKSYGRAHWLADGGWQRINEKIQIAIVQCPVCRGEPAPDWRS
jgi:hypothetical protein